MQEQTLIKEALDELLRNKAVVAKEAARQMARVDLVIKLLHDRLEILQHRPTEIEEGS